MSQKFGGEPHASHDEPQLPSPLIFTPVTVGTSREAEVPAGQLPTYLVLSLPGIGGDDQVQHGPGRGQQPGSRLEGRGARHTRGPITETPAAGVQFGTTTVQPWTAQAELRCACRACGVQTAASSERRIPAGQGMMANSGAESHATFFSLWKYRVLERVVERAGEHRPAPR